MNSAHLDQIIIRLESFVECWKQLNHFMTLARARKCSQEDEAQFLELKSVLAQELELILSGIDCSPIGREDVHAVITASPSIRFLGEMSDGALRNLENQWHKLFIGFQAILGQLKVRQQQIESKSWVSSWFKRRAA